MVSVAQLKDVPTSPSLRPDIAELRSRVAQIAPQIKARAHTTEKAGRVPEENITALRNIGYFDIVKPAHVRRLRARFRRAGRTEHRAR